MSWALTCANCTSIWRELTIDEYLDELKTWTTIPGLDDLFPESFCPVCRAIVVETPEAYAVLDGHDLLQDSSVHCRCGHEYSPVVPSTVRGIKIDWKAVNQERLRHQADVVRSSR